MTETCSTCKGTGVIVTIEDKLKAVMEQLYRTITIEKNTCQGDYVIHIKNHTENCGGEDGDIITYDEIEKFRRLGYKIGSVSKTYVYVKKIEGRKH